MSSSYEKSGKKMCLFGEKCQNIYDVLTKKDVQLGSCQS